MSELPTLIIHGFLAPSLTNLPIHAVLRLRGVDTYDVPIPGLNTQDIARSSAILERHARSVLASTGAPRVDLVGVSMGGVIALHFLRCRGGHALVRRTVTIGSPLRGTPIAKRLAPWLPLAAARQMAPESDLLRAIDTEPHPSEDVVSIFADGDAVVSARSAELAGVRTLRAPVGHAPFGHYELVVHPRNLAFVADQLLGR